MRLHVGERVADAAGGSVCGALAGWLAVLLLVLAGCEPTQRVVRDDWAVWADAMKAGGGNVSVGGRQAAGRDPLTAGLNAARAGGFAVRLAAYDGEDRGARASQDAVWARMKGIAQVWTVEADDVISVYAGRYSRGDDPAGAKLAEQARRLERGEEDVPFQRAEVVQIAAAEAFVGGDPYDLQTHSGTYEYSLQIGFFDVQYEGDRRAAAEAWVRQLREDDRERAFYYHGPHRSMVTVGLFTRRDFVRQGFTEVPGPAINELREKYPHNVGNGMTLRQKDPKGNDLGEQKSFVVRIP